MKPALQRITAVVSRAVAIALAALLGLALPRAARAQDTLGALPQAAVPQAAGPRETLEQFTARITAELRQRSPEAADLFTRAGEEAGREDMAAAEADYRRVLGLVPGWNHAQRRLCNVVLLQRRRAEAVALCREALASDASIVNQSALAFALILPMTGDQPAGEAISEAHGIVERIVDDPQADEYVYRTACLASLAAEDVALLRKCVAGLDVTEPNSSETHYFGFILAANDGHWDEASSRVDRAEAAGLAPEVAREARALIAKERPWWPRLAMAGVWAGGVWAVVMLLLLATGLVLSGAALRAAGRVAAAPNRAPVAMAANVRGAYRIVLWLACLAYYLSLPLVLLAVVGGGALAVMGLFAAGWVPVKLVAVIVIVVVVTFAAMVKSLVVRPVQADPGLRLDPAEHPRLQGVLREVARKIGTRPVDKVFLTPGTELAVFERGGVLGQMRHAAERCLILGVGVLDGFRLGPFKAVLAHEYGHFSNRDTAGGGFALSVRRSIQTMAVGIAQGGAAAWYNPAWLFINAFYRVFLRISQGASRLQEVLADRWAALAYGAAAFERGLRHVISRGVEFEARADAVLKEVIEQHVPLANLYAYQPAAPPPAADVEQAVQAALGAQPSPYDSHPAPAQRLAWVHAMDTRSAGDAADAEAEVWSLFEDRAALEARMTDEVRANVQRAHGVAIAAAASA